VTYKVSMKFELKDRKGLPDWLFLEAAGVKKLFGFFFSIFGFFLEAVGTYCQTGVLAFQMPC